MPIAESPIPSERSAATIHGAAGALRAAVATVADVPKFIEAAAIRGDVRLTDVRRERIRRIALEVGAKALELTREFAELQAEQP